MAHLALTILRGDPITLDQLREVHTGKIHLLIIDGSLTDYDHEHPIPSAIPGRYDFSFALQKPGTYRVWADVQPVATDIQEFAITVIPLIRGSPDLQFRFYAAKSNFTGCSCRCSATAGRSLSLRAQCSAGENARGLGKNNCSSGKSGPTVLNYGIRITKSTLRQQRP